MINLDYIVYLGRMAACKSAEQLPKTVAKQYNPEDYAFESLGKWYLPGHRVPGLPKPAISKYNAMDIGFPKSHFTESPEWGKWGTPQHLQGKPYSGNVPPAISK